MSRVFRSQIFWIAQRTSNGRAGLEAFVSISSSPRPGPQDLFMALKSSHGERAFRFPIFESPLKDPREEHGGLGYSRRSSFPWLEWCLWIHGIRLNICSNFKQALGTDNPRLSFRWSWKQVKPCTYRGILGV